MTVKKAVITAAGWGTRFLPVTKSQPKEMLPLLNKPIIQYSVEEAAACGAELVVIATALGKRAIEDYFDRHYELEQMLERKGETKLLEEVRHSSNMVGIGYIRQKEQLGLLPRYLGKEHRFISVLVSPPPKFDSPPLSIVILRRLTARNLPPFH